MTRNQPRLLVSILVASLAIPVSAGVTAYWRHEEGPAGSTVPVGQNTVLDSSGNGNFMVTFNEYTGGTYTTAVAPKPLRSGLANNLAIDFNFDQDGDGPDLSDDHFTGAVPMNAMLFGEISVELAFKMDTVGGFHTLVGKDGQPTGAPIPPLAVKVRGDDFPGAIQHQLQVEWLDGDGDQHGLFSGFSIVPDRWYHVAFTLDDTTSGLWIAEELGDYVKVAGHDAEDFAGLNGEVIFPDDRSFTVGRGMFANGPADWSNAIIDEVRISDTAIATGDFLFIPEPTTALLCLLAIGMIRRR